MSRFNWHWIHKIAKGRGEWLTLLFSLLLALSIWTIHNLSLKYTTYLQYEVYVNTNLEGRVMDAVSDDALILKARASGYSLMLHSITNNFYMELEPKYFHQISPESDTFVVYISEIQDILEKQLLAGDITSIEDFTTGKMRFVFPRIQTKKVPVVAQTQISYESQYMPISEITLNPDSVLIYGEEKYFHRVNAVYTDVISKRGIKRNFQGVAHIIPIENINISQSQVYYKQVVGRYIEQTVELPLEVINTPKDRDVLPLISRITVKYRQLLSSHKEVDEADFRCVVDYKEVENSINLQVTPKLLRHPDGIYSVSFYPPFVECVVLDRR